MITFLLLLLLLLITSTTTTTINNCRNYDICLDFLRDILKDGSASAKIKSDGQKVELDIQADNMVDNKFVALVYTLDKRMNRDLVAYCEQNDSDTTGVVAGIGFNQRKRTYILGTSESFKSHDPAGFGLELIDSHVDNGTIWCKIRHNVAPVTKHFKTNHLHVLMTLGFLIDDCNSCSFSYQGKWGDAIGMVDLSGEKSTKSATSTEVAVAAVVLIFFMYQ